MQKNEFTQAATLTVEQFKNPKAFIIFLADVQVIGMRSPNTEALQDFIFDICEILSDIAAEWSVNQTEPLPAISRGFKEIYNSLGPDNFSQIVETFRAGMAAQMTSGTPSVDYLNNQLTGFKYLVEIKDLFYRAYYAEQKPVTA